jgi:hypothetical protein
MKSKLLHEQAVWLAAYLEENYDEFIDWLASREAMTMEAVKEGVKIPVGRLATSIIVDDILERLKS